MITRAAGGLALCGAVLLAACTRVAEHTDAGANTTPAGAKIAPARESAAVAASTTPLPSITRVPTRTRRCGGDPTDSLNVAGADSLSPLFALLVDSAPSSEDSLNTATLPAARVTAYVGESGLVYVDSTSAAPPVESKAVRHFSRAAVAEQLTAKRGPVWEALATAAISLAQPETQAPRPFVCGTEDTLTLFVGDGSYRMLFTTEHGALRLTRIAYEAAEGN